MYDQTDTSAACFDPNNIPEQPAIPATATNNGFSSHETKTTTTILHLQESDSNSMGFQNPNLGNHSHYDPNAWDPTTTNHVNLNHTTSEMGFTHFVENLQQQYPTTDFLTLLHLPICSFASSSSSTASLSFVKPSSPPQPPSGSAFGFLGEFNPAMMVDYSLPGSGSSYDPNNLHFNLPPQTSPLLRDLMFHHSLPHEYGNVGNGNGIDEIYQEGDTQFHGNGIFEFGKGNGKAKVGNNNKCPKNCVTEKQRRRNFNDKYDTLSKLIPNQTKTDRASIVLDAINHINELRRTVGELKILVDNKRISKMKRHKPHEDYTHTPDDGNGVDGEAAVVKPEPDDEDYNGSTATQLRSSWIQRKWKDTKVDVRIVDDDVTIKLVQRKKINCLLSVSKTLDELMLDLRHVAGGQVGDYYSYLFNSKICEGSSVYASAIANKLLEVVEREYHAASVSVAPTTSF